MVDMDNVELIIFIFDVLSINRMTSIKIIKYLNKNKVFEMKWIRNALYNIIDNLVYYSRFLTSYFDSQEDIGEMYKMFWYDHIQPIIKKYGC